MVIPFKIENASKTYKKYFYAERYSVYINYNVGPFTKKFKYDFLRVHDIFCNSQFTKELVDQYFTGNLAEDKVQLVSDNGYTYNINLKIDLVYNYGSSLYFVPRNYVFKKYYSIEDIRRFVKEIISIGDYELISKYAKIIKEDFGSLTEEDVYNLYHIENEILKYKKELQKYNDLNEEDTICENKLDRFILENIKKYVYTKYKIDTSRKRYSLFTLKEAGEEIEKLYDDRYNYLATYISLSCQISDNMVKLGYRKEDEELSAAILRLKENTKENFNDIINMIYLKSVDDENEYYEMRSH